MEMMNSLQPMALWIVEQLNSETPPDWTSVLSDAVKKFDTPLVDYCAMITTWWEEEFLPNPIPRPGHAEVMFVGFMISNLLNEFTSACEFYFRYSIFASFHHPGPIAALDFGLILLLNIASMEEELSWVSQVWLLSRCAIVYCLTPDPSHKLLLLCRSFALSRQENPWDGTIMASAMKTCAAINLHRATKIFGPEFLSKLPSTEGGDLYQYTTILDNLFLHQLESPLAN